MDKITEAFATAIAGHAEEIVVLFVMLLGWGVRKVMQVRAAVAGATDVEVEHEERKLAGNATMGGAQKKEIVSARLKELNALVRPLTEKGIAKLIEKAVPKARSNPKVVELREKRTSLPPPPSDGQA